MQLAMLLLPLAAYQSGGLKVSDQKTGTGPVAEPGDRLSMDYTGSLMNGKVFDSSKGRGPFQFILGAGMVIKGWDKGVVGMHVGGKRQLVIPADMAYGAQGALPDIPPNATLKFEIELRGIERVHKEILKQGHGAGLKGGERVTLHYTGTFKDGKKFDSSYDHGQPMTIQFPGQVIPGFTMGLVGMKEGERAKITIPWKLAYGEQGRPPVIPPKSDLVFVLDIVQISH